MELVGGDEVACGVTELDCAEGGPVPMEFVAVTENEYVRPLLSPEIVQDKPDVVQVKVPLGSVAVYDVMGEPPSEAGGDHDTVA